MVRNYLYILTGVLFLYACGSCGNKGASGTNGLNDIPDDVVNLGIAEISEEAMQGFVDNMSSPVEMAALIKSLNVGYSNKYLAPTDKIEDYTTNFQQAFSLGVYGLDLGYLNMYNKTNTVLDYISAIKTLADAINVGQFFDFTTLKRLAQNNQNLDSLMYISVHSFNQMDNYLRKTNRSNLSVLIVTGLWLEGNYLATQVYKEAPHPALKERIGEQKIIIEKLMIFLQNFKSDKQFQNLISELSSLQEEYKNVSITIELGEPEAVEKDGMLTFIQHDKSIVNISDETVQRITQKTEDIRNKLIRK
ncbi:MAG: hypothetical protein JXB34_07780 [Bacteroidales bacterium]|nr:hypothetical protein [Bacteroidales bacterium]